MRLTRVGRLLLGLLLTLGVLVSCQASEPTLIEAADTPQPIAPLQAQTIAQPNSKPWIWWEAEKPAATNFPPADQNPFAPQTPPEVNALSGGRWLGVEGKRSRTLFLEYTVTVPRSGEYTFYARKFWQHGPFRWRWDDQPWQQAGTDLYLLDDVPLRQFVGVNWVNLGRVDLSQQKHKLRIELTQRDGAAGFDCFLLTQAPLWPRGRLKPNQRYQVNLPGWFLFDPDPDPFKPSPIDLRFLNEARAGEQGFIQVKGETLVHEKTGQPIRFWAVNTGTDTLQMDPAAMASMARFLAKAGVNLVRLHGPLWAPDSRQIDRDRLTHLFTFIAALKQEGIYTALSIYFPLWTSLGPDSGFAGYNNQPPFGLIFFNPQFQQLYFQWWQTVLTTVNPQTGKALRDDPAVALVELVNEDSTLFWTFSPYEGIPAAQMELLEQQFGTWLTQRYGSLAQALATWGQGDAVRGDGPASGRIGVLPPGALLQRRETRRAQDTAAFLIDRQQTFFQTALERLKQDMGYRGLVYASNWITADAQVLGPLDKYSNTVADLMDRHGYFSGPHKGPRATYSLSSGDTYQDRSALRFAPLTPGQTPDYSLPIMDLRYNGLPSITTEINWPMPNRFRAELPLLAAAYGLLQGTDGFCFFAINSSHWVNMLGKFTVASPAILGQFPAAALIYRLGLLQPGRSVADVSLKLADLLALKGAPLAVPQNLDELRARDIPADGAVSIDRAVGIDPLAFLVGQVNLRFGEQNTSQVVDLTRYLDRATRVIRSTTGELTWDYGRGLVTVNAPQAQAVTGFLRQAGVLQLPQVEWSSDLDYGTLMLVALDGQPLDRSNRMLLQVMSTEQNFGWQTSGYPERTIESIGSAPIVVRQLSGQVALRRANAAQLKVTALDFNGYPRQKLGRGDRFSLLPDAFYYLLER